MGRTSAVAVLSAGLLITAIARADGPVPRTITTHGDAIAYTRPDEVDVTFGVQKFAKSLDESTAANDGASASLMRAIQGVGIDENDIQVANMTVDIQYANNDAGFQTNSIAGYVTSRSYSVKLRDLKLFEALVTAALKNGANQMQGFNFQAPNAAPLFDQVRREAVRDAQEKAAVLARELECKPGSPITITEREGIGSNEGGGAGSALGQVGGQMMPEGKIEIWAAVDITFELKDNAAQ
ncbi:MAG TPA: SIMPL domain-containing protein [Tepidisphaeraceae bacterium]|nr:SIMPL domain-containing protein [Tepidisphaeraceae bacterium]